MSFNPIQFVEFLFSVRKVLPVIAVAVLLVACQSFPIEPFFTQSCRTVAPTENLMAKSIALLETIDGSVWMVQTTLKQQDAWVPIPWHNWS